MDITFIKRLVRMNYDRLSDTDLLNTLWLRHCQRFPVDNAEITQLFQSIDREIQSLSKRRRNIIFNEIIELCISHEHYAFITGIQMGAQLALEITDCHTSLRTGSQ